MKTTGIVRKMDDLGRVVIPIELRRTLGIDKKDAVEISADREKITIKKHNPALACHITGEVAEDNIKLAGGKLVLSKKGAEQMLEELQQLFVNN